MMAVMVMVAVAVIHASTTTHRTTRLSGHGPHHDNRGYVKIRRKEIPLGTDNLLEDTDRLLQPLFRKCEAKC